ncbi:MAG TPA: DUF1918 domain-containing protein [Actinomycetota bacterium]|nr:DUF1918 domain-containing protein [Actinomycetota bacterium]
MEGKAGDRLIVESKRVDQPAREGQILEVIRRGSTVAYRVRWSDGHESVFTPGAGSARIEPRRRTA